MNEDHPFVRMLIAAGLYKPNLTPPRIDLSGLPSATAGDPAAARYAAAALRYETDAVANAVEGTRNDTLNRAAFKLATLVGAGHLDGNDVVDHLSEAARSAGLLESEISATLRSGIGAGSRLPREVVLDPRRGIPEAHTVSVDSAEKPAAPADGMAPRSSWRQVDLTTVLAGTYRPPEPSVGRRDDGVGLFYPGRVHTVASESEGGKTWFALLAVRSELDRGNAAVYLDFEDDEGGIVGRLLELGVSRETIAERFAYLRPDSSIMGAGNRDDLAELLDRLKPTLVVIDGVTEAMTLHGLELKDNSDVARFDKLLPRWIADRGPAVVALDHVTKDREGRGRYALGAVHKINGVSVAYVLENREPFGIGRSGRSTVLLAKDRPAQLRRHAVHARGGLHWFADLLIESVVLNGAPALTASLLAPGRGRSPETDLMVRVSEALAHAVEPALTTRDVQDRVPGRSEDTRAALATLVDRGYVSVEKGPYNSKLHKSIKPFGDQA